MIYKLLQLNILSHVILLIIYIKKKHFDHKDTWNRISCYDRMDSFRIRCNKYTTDRQPRPQINGFTQNVRHIHRYVFPEGKFHFPEQTRLMTNVWSRRANIITLFNCCESLIRLSYVYVREKLQIYMPFYSWTSFEGFSVLIYFIRL